MRLTELRKEYKEATGEDWNKQTGVYVNFLERKLITPLEKGQTLPIDSVVGSNICKSCGLDLDKEECMNCQIGFG